MVLISAGNDGDGEYGRWCRVGHAFMVIRAAGWGNWFIVGCVGMLEVSWSDWPEVGGWSR